MYLPLSPYSHQRYSSLNNSIIQVNPIHVRTHSNAKIVIPPSPQIERLRVPSQKKLTLTCQTNLPSNRIHTNEGENHLKKRGGDFKEMKLKFTSLQVSQVCETAPSTHRQNAQQDQLGEVKKTFAERFRQLQAAYAANLKQHESHIKLLQLKLSNNSRQLQAKTKKIQLLETACNHYKAKLQKIPQQPSNNALMIKINDLQAKLRILVHHCLQIKQEQDHSLNNISSKLLGQLGTRVTSLRNKTQNFLKLGFSSIKKIQQKVDYLKQQNEKLSVGTRESMASVSSERKKTNPSFHSQDQCGISFWDDCFFYPNESQKSENFELIVEMTKRRQQALSCWLDQNQFLRYSDSNSFIFNRKGDRIRLSKEQLRELVNLKVILLL